MPRKLASRGVVVILHGGFWLAQYGADLGAPLAADLLQRGYATWNLEYRRIGNGGGWPHTFQDVAAGIDHLRVIAPRAGLDVQNVVAIGHSAGGQLATWASGRCKPSVADPDAATRVELDGVVSQAGVLDLAEAARHYVGGNLTQQLMGGEPAKVPARYAIASPQEMLPNRVPVRCVHSRSDLNVPYAQSVNYVAAARRAGAVASLDTVPGDHFSLITVGTPAWEATVRRTVELLR
ncbi:MAG: alpha/beta fold hydrolase [Actinomycetota bacterium]|nr:alpha/beta fold hydrolase [Actinomycetota bacterium]